MSNKKIVKSIKSILLEKTTQNIKDVILFGSRNTGNADEFSDYDILIILDQDYDWIIEDKIYDLCYDVMLEADIIIDVKIISVNELNSDRGKQPYIQNAINTGLYA